MNDKKEMKRQNGKIVLGDGEVTGHQHTISEKSAKLYQVSDDMLQLKLPKAAALRHEKGDVPAEHREIKLPPGEPIVHHKRAYSPDGWTKVVD